MHIMFSSVSSSTFTSFAVSFPCAFVIALHSFSIPLLVHWFSCVLLVISVLSHEFRLSDIFVLGLWCAFVCVLDPMPPLSSEYTLPHLVLSLVFCFFLPLFSLTVNMDYPCVKPPACILNSDNKNYIHPNKEHAEFTLLCHVSSNGFFFWVNHNVYIFMHLSSQVLVSCGLVILFH